MYAQRYKYVLGVIRGNIVKNSMRKLPTVEIPTKPVGKPYAPESPTPEPPPPGK
jgi:hypothetical protein